MKKKIHKYRYDLAIALVLILIFSFFYIERDQFGMFSDRESFQSFVSSFGFFGPLVVIGSIVLEVVIAPIPGFIPAISAGFIFGPILGSVYTYIGNILGTLIVFLVARRYGKPLIARFIKGERLEKYCKTIAKHENYLLVFYFLPILPIDVITAAFGLSHIRKKKFFIVSSIGFVLYSIAATNFGDYLAKLWFI